MEENAALFILAGLYITAIIMVIAIGFLIGNAIL